jgi:uncharacterized membrane-anchored protein
MPTQPPRGDPVPGATVIASLTNGSPWTRPLRSKVPRVTPRFWILTLLATTLGATGADGLSADLDLGLMATTAVMSLLLTGTLVSQLSTRRCHPGHYWSSVALCSTVGALLADTLAADLGLGFWAVTVSAALALAATFAAWHHGEHTVSVHNVLTRRREACYWIAVGCAATLGPSLQDFLSRRLGAGHLTAVLLCAGVIVMIAVVRPRHAVVAFWAAYVALWPLGAAISDSLIAGVPSGGLALPPDLVCAVLLLAMLVVGGVSSVAPHRSGAGQVGRPTVGP